MYLTDRECKGWLQYVGTKNLTAKSQKKRTFAYDVLRRLFIVMITEVTHRIVFLVLGTKDKELVPVEKIVPTHKLSEFPPLGSTVQHHFVASTPVNGGEKVFGLSTSILLLPMP